MRRDYSIRLMYVVKRLRGDMLDVFKILNDIDNVDREQFSIYSRSTSKGHTCVTGEDLMPCLYKYV